MTDHITARVDTIKVSFLLEMAHTKLLEVIDDLSRRDIITEPIKARKSLSLKDLVAVMAVVCQDPRVATAIIDRWIIVQGDEFHALLQAKRRHVKKVIAVAAVDRSHAALLQDLFRDGPGREMLEKMAKGLGAKDRLDLGIRVAMPNHLIIGTGLGLVKAWAKKTGINSKYASFALASVDGAERFGVRKFNGGASRAIKVPAAALLAVITADSDPDERRLMPLAQI